MQRVGEWKGQDYSYGETTPAESSAGVSRVMQKSSSFSGRLKKARENWMWKVGRKGGLLDPIVVNRRMFYLEASYMLAQAEGGSKGA